jgi:nitroreductase/NAD-dependent dihydropyrimidine dehydrogenase PreA subunit
MANEISFIIDNEKCSGCGRCAVDCQRRVLELQNNKAAAVSANCFKCGHCFAICPENAVKLSGCDDEICEISDKQVFLDENKLKAHLKARRSIRQYKDTPVEKEKIEKIIEAGRLTPTAGNSQDVRYIVVKNDIDAIEDAVIAQYKLPAELPPTEDQVPPGHFVAFPAYYSPDRLKRGFLFHKAPQVILVISSNETNGCLAAMSMELMAEALGLGTVYVRLFTRPANLNKKLRESLGVAEEELIAACLAIGYPNVKYLRNAPKKAANIVWR